MKKVLLVLAMFGLMIPASPIQSFTYSDDFFVVSMDISATTDSITFSWTTAELPSVDLGTPKIVVLAADSIGSASPEDFVELDWVTYNQHLLDNVGTVNLPDNDYYAAYLVYEDPNDILSGYTDPLGLLLEDLEDAQSFVLVMHVKAGLKFTSIDKSYAMPGEKIRLYGIGIGDMDPGWDPARIHGQIGPEEYSTTEALSGTIANPYRLYLSEWTTKYIELTVPEYDASKTYQKGKLYFDGFIVPDGNYDDNIFIEIVENDEAIDRPIESGYLGSEYRYLLNATRYMFNQKRTVATFGQEQEQMQWVSNYLTSIGKGIDATWALILAYGRVYGDYSEEEIQKEINFGPGCIHATIPQAVWSQMPDYDICMANSL